MTSECGYLLTNMMSALSFLENLDSSSLSITPEEFEAGLLASRQVETHASKEGLPVSTTEIEEVGDILPSNSPKEGTTEMLKVSNLQLSEPSLPPLTRVYHDIF